MGTGFLPLDRRSGFGNPGLAATIRVMRPIHPVLWFLIVAFGILVLPGPGIPATADEDAPVGPRLVVDPLEHDFGPVGQEQEFEASFTYRNEGDARLTGIRAIGDCGCYGVTLTHEELDPGESGTLTVKFRTLMFNGHVSKKLRILTGNGPRTPVTVKLHLDVISGVILAPGRLWFGDVLVGSTPSKAVYAKWHAEAGKAFRVTSVEIPGCDFDIHSAPYEQGKWKGTVITFAFKEAPSLGMFSATALLRTDHPDYPRISLPVTAHVTGKVWVQSRTIYFGWIRKGESKKTSILIKPFSKDVELGTVTASSRDGRVEVEVEEHPLGRPGWWRLLVEVPEDAEVGEITDVIEVHSSVPGEETTEIAVRGEVMAIAR